MWRDGFEGPVLLTGATGYLGQRLHRYLQDEQGVETVGVDVGMFAEPDPGYPVQNRKFEELKASDLAGVKAIIHLAGLSNDPICDLDYDHTFKVNTHDAIILAEEAAKAGVDFILASSCALYGHHPSQEDRSSPPLLSEHVECKPIKLYAQSKLRAERAIYAMHNGGFRVVSLRMGTLGGHLYPGCRFRFDLCVNTMVKTALLDGVIRVYDPDVWRPLLDIHDACRAYYQALRYTESGIFNIAGYNRTTWNAAEEIEEALEEEGLEVEVVSLDKAESLTYRVSNITSERWLHWKPEVPPGETARQLLGFIRSAGMEVLHDPGTINVKAYKNATRG